MEDKGESSKEYASTEVALVELASASNNGEQRESEVPPMPGANLDSFSWGIRPPHFRLYRQRHAGVFAIIALNVVAGMNLTWFGPVANKTSETFGISLDEVNWLGNIVACTYIVVSPLVPIVCTRFGLRISYAIGTGFLILSAWVRYAGTAQSLGSRSAYALLIIGQFLSAIPQVVFQVLAPKFSETWFGLKGRTTATMLMSVSNPVGTALGQLISPMINDIRTSILVLGIISTAIAPITLLVSARPPTPPSYSGSRPSHHFFTTLRAIFGVLRPPPPKPSRRAEKTPEVRPPSACAGPVTRAELESPVSNASKTESEAEDRVVELRDSPVKTHARYNAKEGGESLGDVGEEVDAYMTLRERFDFVILTSVFSVLVSGVNTFSILSNEILEPYGYSEDTAGLMGAALLLSGLVMAFVTAPLFDRVLTHHLGLSVRIAVPIIAAAWLSLIWAVRPSNTAALYAIFVIIGVCSIAILPVSLELGCELTRNSDASSAILWCSANIASIVFTLVMSALRASSNASPPLNMHRSVIYNGVSICCAAVFILLFRGEQRRRERDVRVAAEAIAAAATATQRQPDVQGSHTDGKDSGTVNTKRRMLFDFLGTRGGRKVQGNQDTRTT